MCDWVIQYDGVAGLAHLRGGSFINEIRLPAEYYHGRLFACYSIMPSIRYL